MAAQFKNLVNVLSDVKSRSIILATVGVLFVAVIIGIVGLRRHDAASSSQAKLQSAPQGIQSIPGINPASPEYTKLQEQLNEKRRQQAVSQSQSFVPTVINKSDKTGQGIAASVSGLLSGDAGRTTPSPDDLGGGGDTLPNAGNASSSGNNGADDAEKQNMKQKLADMQEQMNQDQEKLKQLNEQQVQQETQQEQQNMTTEAKALMASWTGQNAPTQSFVEGSAKDTMDQQKAQQAAAAAAIAQQPGPPIIKAGTILFATLNTSVNSDEPGPVLATILTGEYKNSRLVGSVQQTQDPSGLNRPERVQLNFTTMNMPDAAKTIGISAVAIDPDTARTALASNVDHHYLLRYGTLFASSFMEGYGNAVTQSGQIVTNFASGGQSVVNQQLNPRQEFAAGLGQVGQQWGEQMGQIFNRPNTITVNAGTSMGILFLSDVTLNTPPSTFQPPMAPAASTTSSTPATGTTMASTTTNSSSTPMAGTQRLQTSYQSYNRSAP